jgi:hypothetical protein
MSGGDYLKDWSGREDSNFRPQRADIDIKVSKW